MASVADGTCAGVRHDSLWQRDVPEGTIGGPPMRAMPIGCCPTGSMHELPQTICNHMPMRIWDGMLCGARETNLTEGSTAAGTPDPVSFISRTPVVVPCAGQGTRVCNPLA